MKLRKMILNSLLLAIGLVLHYITPPIVFGMKPDFLLAVMFICIAMCDDYKSAAVVGVISGVLTALTTTFPGGQIPNFIDKIVTSNAVYFAFKIMKNKVPGQIEMAVISASGTLISGCVFIEAAKIMAGLSGSFKILLFSIVLPACVINMIACIVLYNTAKIALKKNLSDN